MKLCQIPAVKVVTLESPSVAVELVSPAPIVNVTLVDNEE